MGRISSFRPTAMIATIALLGCLTASAPAQDTAGKSRPATSLTATNGVVLHNVDTRTLAARFRQVDRDLRTEGGSESAARALAELLAGDLSALVEDGEGVYLEGIEAANLRAALLPPAGRDVYRDVVDGSARAALATAVVGRDVGMLRRAARRYALSSEGPRILVTLADVQTSRGRTGNAILSLETLLRYWPREPMPGVSRGDVVSRLAALYAPAGDVAGIEHLADTLAATLLEGPSPVVEGASLARELREAATRAALLDPHAPPAGPTRPLVARAEFTQKRLGLSPTLTGRGREILVDAVAVAGPRSPILLTRYARPPFGAPRLLALAPPTTATVVENEPAALRVLWSWPDAQRLQVFQLGPSGVPFTPTVVGDLILFPWPSARETDDDTEPLHDLVMLSLSKEGKDMDVRGSDEERRRDPHPELEALSFCGRPVVRGRRVFTTLVGRAPEDGTTQLHVAAFDVVAGRAPGEHRLRLRWKRHLLDGNPVAPARFPYQERTRITDPMAYPTSLAERYGRLYVGSNSGAVACLDGEDGRVVWIETYAQPRTQRHILVPTNFPSWKHSAVLVDGPYVHLSPRDSQHLLRYAAAPMLPTRSMLVERRPVRGMGTSTTESSVVGDLDPDELVAVRDGVALISGAVSPSAPDSLGVLRSPLVALRLRGKREGEMDRRLRWAQIPDFTSAGAPCLVRGGVLFPSYKAVYRIPFPGIEQGAQILYETPSRMGYGKVDDRIGNLVPDGPRLWSVTPDRIVLFEEK